MDIQKITLNVNNSKETVKTLHIVGGEHGNGMQGRAVHIHAQPNVTYQLIDDATHLGPENIVVKRDGQNLLISFKGGDLQHPDLVIDDYYKPNGELGYNAGSNNLLLGQASNGHFYAYIPESGQGHDAVSILANEVSAGQVLGGADHANSPWWQADVASANIPTAGTEATPLLPVNTEPAGANPTPVMAHAEHNTQVPASADDTSGIGADDTNIENAGGGFELFSAFVAAATAGSIYEAHADDGKTTVDNSTTTPTPSVTPPVTPAMPYTFDASSGLLSVHDNSPLDYSQLHDVKTIDLDDNATAQDLSISAKDVMDITPSADHTLYITSTDTNDHVTLDSGFTADTSADKDMNGVHFKAYTDSTQPDVHLFVQDGLLATAPSPTMPYTFDASSGLLSVHDNSPLDYSQLHDVKTIDLDDNATAQDLSISAKDVMDITPSADHTLYITSTDANDHVTLDSGFTADISADKDMNGVHFKAYTDSTQPDVHLFVQDGLLAAAPSPAMPYTFDSASGVLTLHDASPIDFSQLHDVKTITMDDNSLAQPLSITAKDVMDITPSADHTLYIHSDDVNDKVTLGSQLTADTSADKDMGSVHYSAYVDASQPDLHLFVQTNLIA